MKVWGLTGNIACGKSAVEAMLRERGVAVIDADEVAREVVAPGNPALEAIVRAFGTGVLQEDGTLDRKGLGALVFADTEARHRLEAITHPRIAEGVARRLAALAEDKAAAAVVSAALMVESGSYKIYEGVAVVTCPESVQLERLMTRDGCGESEARARIESQMPQGAKQTLAQVVIDNGGTPEGTRAQVDRWAERLLA